MFCLKSYIFASKRLTVFQNLVGGKKVVNLLPAKIQVFFIERVNGLFIFQTFCGNDQNKRFRLQFKIDAFT